MINGSPKNGSDLNKAETRNSKLKKDFRVTDPLKAASELAHILLNLRHFSKLWDDNYGVEAKKRKKFWEQKADEYLESIEKK